MDGLSHPSQELIKEINQNQYYNMMGHDGEGLKVPADLDDSICLYLELSSVDRNRFDRAAFWVDMAWEQWGVSVSASFASLVSAVEALSGRGDIHPIHCPVCSVPMQHEVPGATERFRAFVERYAPGKGLRKRRSRMYELRSGILHGSALMELDVDRAFGWDPPWWNQRELHDELWSTVHVSLRNWLKAPS